MHIVLIALVLDFSGWCWPKRCCPMSASASIPRMNSWGNMINGAPAGAGARTHRVVVAGGGLRFMFALVLAANLFADVVRDAFDPRLEGRR